MTSPKSKVTDYAILFSFTFCLNFLKWNIESSGASTNLHLQSIRISFIIVNNHRSPIRNQLSLRLYVWIVQTWHLSTIFAEAARKQRTVTRSRKPCNKLIHWLMKINRMNRNRFMRNVMRWTCELSKWNVKTFPIDFIEKTEILSLAFCFVECKTRLPKENWKQKTFLQRRHTPKNRRRKATKPETYILEQKK